MNSNPPFNNHRKEMKCTVGIVLCLLVACLLFCQTASAKKQDDFEKVLIKALALLTKKQKKERLRFSHTGFVPRISDQADEKIITTGLGRIVKKNGRSYWVLADEKIVTNGLGRVTYKNGRSYWTKDNEGQRSRQIGLAPMFRDQADEKIITTGLGRIVKKNGRSYWVLADEKITTTGMGRVKCKNGRCFYVNGQ